MIERQVDLILLGWSMEELGSATGPLCGFGRYHCTSGWFFFRRGPSSYLLIPGHLFLCHIVLLCQLCWSGCSRVCLANNISEMNQFKKKKKKKSNPKKEDGNKKLLELIMLPLPCCFSLADFKHGETGAVSLWSTESLWSCWRPWSDALQTGRKEGRAQEPSTESMWLFLWAGNLTRPNSLETGCASER